MKVSKQDNPKELKMSKLTNQVAVITGASKGIGAEIAKSLAAAGASVVVNYATSKQGADAVVSAITAKGGKAIAVQGDVSKQADITRLFAETKQAFGRLDILVNNAGIYAFATLDQITEESFHAQFNLNVLGLLLTTKEAVPYFSAEGGSIINISSAVTTLYPAASSTYTATKASVDAITIILSKELGPKKIRVNAINPGIVETEGIHTAGFFDSDFHKEAIADTPLGRTGQPDDITPAAVYLASSDAKFITGQTLNISGGIR
jgi:3-oxoacyl-[acyl-carrier protein] reductase